MAQKLLDSEIGPGKPGHATARAKYNNFVDEFNEDKAAGFGGTSGGGIEWVSGNSLSRVTAVVAGRVRTMLLRAGGDPVINPSTAGTGPANWRVSADFVRLTAALGPYLGVGTIAYYSGAMYELLTSYTSLPTGASTSQWRLIGTAQETTNETVTLSPPTSLAAVRRADPNTTLDVSWTASSPSTGVIGYRVTINSGNVPVYEGTATSIAVQNAPTGQHTITVWAYGEDNVTSSAVTTTVSAVGSTRQSDDYTQSLGSLQDAQGAPPTGAANSVTKLDLSVGAPAGGFPSGTTYEWEIDNRILTSNNGSIQVTGLSEDTTYPFTARAVNVGNQTRSADISGSGTTRADTDIQSQPVTNINVTPPSGDPTSRTKLDVSFGTPPNPSTKWVYDISMSPGGQTATVTGGFKQFAGLSPNTTYTASIVTRHSGTGNASAAATGSGTTRA